MRYSDNSDVHPMSISIERFLDDLNHSWNYVKEFESETKIDTINSYLKLRELKSIKMALYASMWDLTEEAEEILTELDREQPADTATQFFITYTKVILKKIKKVKNIQLATTSDTKFLEEWLILEYIARNSEFKAIIEHLRQLSAKERQERWVKVALIRSLDMKRLTSRERKKLSEIIPVRKGDDRLDISYRYFINRTLIENETCFEYERDQALEAIKVGEIEDALRRLDNLARGKNLNKDLIFLWLSISISQRKGLGSFEDRCEFALSQSPQEGPIRTAIAAYLLILYWKEQSSEHAHKTISQHIGNLELIRKRESKDFNSAANFFTYVLKLFSVRQIHKNFYTNGIPKNNIHVVGESHSLALSGMNLLINNKSYSVKNNFVMGIQMNHFENPTNVYRARCVEDHLFDVKENDIVLFTIGEIDTRPNEGIWIHKKKTNANLSSIIKNTVNRYVISLVKLRAKCKSNEFIVQGIPAPNYLCPNKLGIEQKNILKMIKEVNTELKFQCLRNNFLFLDVYEATAGEDGLSNRKFHIDKYHLSPLFYSLTQAYIKTP